jgi:hypothetical protein
MIIESILLMSMLCSASGNQEKIVENKSVEQSKRTVIKQIPIYDELGIPKWEYLKILHEAEEMYPNSYHMQNIRIRAQITGFIENQQLRRGMQ